MTITTCNACACIVPTSRVVNGHDMLEFHVLAPQDGLAGAQNTVTHDHTVDNAVGLKQEVRDFIKGLLLATPTLTPSLLLPKVHPNLQIFLIILFRSLTVLPLQIKTHFVALRGLEFTANFTRRRVRNFYRYHRNFYWKQYADNTARSIREYVGKYVRNGFDELPNDLWNQSTRHASRATRRCARAQPLSRRCR